MQRERADLLYPATYRMQQRDTALVRNGSLTLSTLKLTNPMDFITNVHVPINLRITNPPRTVLISGIPLCFAYKAYSFTKILAIRAKPTWRN
jgi:hypothetical protein